MMVYSPKSDLAKADAKKKAMLPAFGAVLSLDEIKSASRNAQAAFRKK